jgi:hypothetical protein
MRGRLRVRGSIEVECDDNFDRNMKSWQCYFCGSAMMHVRKEALKIMLEIMLL